MYGMQGSGVRISWAPLGFQGFKEAIIFIFSIKKSLSDYIDLSPRVRSTLYTLIRLKLKNLLITKLNLNITGLTAIELKPIKLNKEIRKAAYNFFINV